MGIDSELCVSRCDDFGENISILGGHRDNLTENRPKTAIPRGDSNRSMPLTTIKAYARLGSQARPITGANRAHSVGTAAPVPFVRAVHNTDKGRRSPVLAYDYRPAVAA